MESANNLSVIGAVVGILVFILVFRNWKPLGLIEWIGAFLFAGTIGSLLGWLWNILPSAQRETYVVYLIAGLVGLLMVHLGDVITDYLKKFLQKLSPGSSNEHGYEPGCSYIALILVLVALVFVTEPFLHLMSTVYQFFYDLYNQFWDAVKNLDVTIGNQLWLVVVGIVIAFFAYLAYTARRRNSTVRQILRDFESGCAISMGIILILVAVGIFCILA